MDKILGGTMRPLRYGVTEYDREITQPGYVVLSPMRGQECFLLGMGGEIVHQWHLPAILGNYGYLLENGNLFVSVPTTGGPKLNAGAGRLLELDKDSNIVRDYIDPMQHHDFQLMPNGNIIYLAWELTPTSDSDRVRGGIPGSEHDDGGIHEDVLREVDGSGKVVWEWHVKDHMDYEKYSLRASTRRKEYGHANTCHVRSDGNLLISFRELDLIILVNRQTGNIDWEMCDRGWGGQHDCQWLDNENILLFANGSDQPTAEYSRILEINSATKQVVWQYKGKPQHTFYSPRISGVHRMPNGNTFICEGNHGRLFEVTRAGDIVWEYVSPFFHTHNAFGEVNHIYRARKYIKDDPRLNGLINK